MDVAFLLAGFGFGIAGVWMGALAWIVGMYYIAGYVGSKHLQDADYWWYTYFIILDIALGSWLLYRGYGGTVPAATTLLVFMACVSAYAGMNRGFLYEYYPAIGGAVNTLFIVLIGYYLFTHN